MTAIIKVIVLLVVVLLIVFYPSAVVKPFRLSFVIVTFIVSALAVPFISGINSKTLNNVIEKPDWNANPLDLHKPLNLFQFLGYGAIVAGVTSLLNIFIRYQVLNHTGFMSVSCGLGLLAGVYFTYKIRESKSRK